MTKPKRTKEEIENNLHEKSYKNIGAWIKDSQNEYNWARKQDWYEEVVQKYGLREAVVTKRTKQDVENNLARKKYKNVGAWIKDNSAEQQWSKKKDWYDEIVQKFELVGERRDRTREEIEVNLTRKKYNNIKAWKNDDQAEYCWALKQEWYKDVVKKFGLRESERKSKQNVENNLSRKKYKNIKAWQNDNQTEYAWAKKHDWFEECVQKFGLREIKLDRTREEVESNIARKEYKNIKAWTKDNISECSWARKQDWYEEVVQKYGLRELVIKRSREEVEENLARKKYKNIKAWMKDNSPEQRWARKQDWYEEVVQKYGLREEIRAFKKEEIFLFLYKNNITSQIQWRRMKGCGASYSSKQEWYPECLEIIKLNKLRNDQRDS